jgi:Tfp pilus assembly protein PilX
MKQSRVVSFHRDEGSALVLTLLAVVLVSLAVLAFFASVTSNREIENSRAHNTQSDQMARTACDYVAGEFLEEITNYSTASTTTPIVYAPIANTNAVPIRNISSALVSDPNYFNLIRQSIPAADPNASGDNTGTAAQNGPAIGTNQWNAPMLLSGAGFSDPSQLPNWVYVDRVNGVTKTAASTTIGRFAYNVYDIGGLLNANVAGYPSAVAADPSLVAQLKNSVAGADLTQLSPNLHQTDVDNLIAFRNPTISGDTNTFYLATQSSAANGFLNPTTAVTNSGTVTYYTNNFFNGRQDLLRYARTQNIPLTNATPYLTTFSRSVNAPTWEPLINTGVVTEQNEGANSQLENYNYFNNASASTSTNPFTANVRFPAETLITHYNDDGTSQTYTVQPGDPLLQRRFSLAKLAWLTHTGPAAGISNAAIQACFGLVWNTSGTWVYAGPTGNSPLSAIETLNQVAAENREPNFFEVLQAGILHGSLGATGHTNPIVAGSPDWGFPTARYGASYRGIDMDEWNRYYEILRIGANIIDQAGADNYPTAIQFSGNEITEANGYKQTTLEVWGIKDLPYLSKIMPVIYWPNEALPVIPPGNNNGPVYNYYAFELWNPHQQSSSTVLKNGPTQFRLTVAPVSDSSETGSAGTYKITYTAADGSAVAPSFDTTGSPSIRLSFFNDAPNYNITFTADGTSAVAQQSYRQPELIRTGVVGSTEKCACPQDPLLDVFDLGVSQTSPDAIHNSVAYNVWASVFVLLYKDTDGTWRPYTTFEGRPDRNVTGFGGNTGDSAGHNTIDGGDPTTGIGVETFPKADPRSFRFDAAWSGTAGTEVPWINSGGAYAYSTYGVPDFTGSDNAELGYLSSNSSAVANQFYADPDGVVRAGDSYYQNQNPYAGNMNARPIILGRPFQSVAEMGYAFRDVAFKTLDFFTNQSGDAALLDLFSVYDEPPIGAARVSLNTMQPLVQQSLLGGTTNLPSGVTSAVLSADYQKYSFSSGLPTANLPTTVAQLANFSYAGTTNSFGSVYDKVDREAAARGLSSSTQTRTWNLLIDVVAQTGRFPGSSTSGGNFLVQGEKHCWLSIAIDRYTGKIVDQQLEFINE